MVRVLPCYGLVVAQHFDGGPGVLVVVPDVGGGRCGVVVRRIRKVVKLTFEVRS